MVPVNRTIIRISSRSRLIAPLSPSTSLPSRAFTTTTPKTQPPSQSTQKRAHESNATTATNPPKDASLSQGHVADSSNLHEKDVHSQSARGGMGTKHNKEGGPVDAASGKGVEKAQEPGESKGNPEGIGMADQVGSASGSARK